MVDREENIVYVDFDGVIANFDKRALELLGMTFEQFESETNSDEAWDRLFEADPNFFENLEPMEDARELIDGVKRISGDSFIVGLTGAPKRYFNVSEKQKQNWAKKNFPDVLPIVCLSKDKCTWMLSGDVIIDDFDKHRHLWVERGGHWILHKNAKDSLAELEELYK